MLKLKTQLYVNSAVGNHFLQKRGCATGRRKRSPLEKQDCLTSKG